jgi:hypothetical protein
MRLSILFTPWGEALIRPWYQQALAKLSHLPQIDKVAIQTNLSCRLAWTDQCDLQKLALWCTWHPSQIAQDDFLAQCGELVDRGIRYSVGVVGLREAFDAIRQLREKLLPQVYLWINAYKDQPDYYSPQEAELLASIDPLFPINNTRHPSLGRRCLTGQRVISVDGDGNIRRCHSCILVTFTSPTGHVPARTSLHQRNVRLAMSTRSQKYPLYDAGLLERIPREALWATATSAIA